MAFEQREGQEKEVRQLFAEIDKRETFIIRLRAILGMRGEHQP